MLNGMLQNTPAHYQYQQTASGKLPAGHLYGHAPRVHYLIYSLRRSSHNACCVRLFSGALNRSPLGSGDHSQALLGRGRSPGRGGSLAASWNGVSSGRHWPGSHGPPRHLQLVDRASSPLTLPEDGSLPPGGLRVPSHWIFRTCTGPRTPWHALAVVDANASLTASLCPSCTCRPESDPHAPGPSGAGQAGGLFIGAAACLSTAAAQAAAPAETEEGGHG